ncbi:hypothetical protein BDN71DRAFT_1367646, partial [Pleurotus eryngii]
SFTLDLPARLKQCGVHNMFHASLLQVHSPNDDRLFPGRLDTQVFEIISHSGRGAQTLFELKWKSGDKTWLPLHQIQHPQAPQAYLDVYGI